MSADGQATLRQAITVYVCASTSGSRDRYHTDRECPRIDADRAQPKPLSVLDADIRECRYCAGEVEPSTPDMGHFESLKAAAREEAD